MHSFKINARSFMAEKPVNHLDYFQYFEINYFDFKFNKYIVNTVASEYKNPNCMIS